MDFEDFEGWEISNPPPKTMKISFARDEKKYIKTIPYGDALYPVSSILRRRSYSSAKQLGWPRLLSGELALGFTLFAGGDASPKLSSSEIAFRFGGISQQKYILIGIYILNKNIHRVQRVNSNVFSIRTRWAGGGGMNGIDGNATFLATNH